MEILFRIGEVGYENAPANVRFLGGNLRATYDFAKKVAAVINGSF